MATESALKKFARGGVVLEGRGPKLLAAAIAISALTGLAPSAEAMPRHRPVEVKIPYQEILKDIRSQVEAEFPGQIFIVDRMADPRKEAARLAKAVGIPPQFTDIDAEMLTGPARSAPFQGTKKSVCVVIGAEPWISGAEINALPPDMPVKMGMLDDANAHKTVLWHEVGHCIVGASEAKADSFGALKMMSELKSTKSVETLVVTREMSEWIGPPGDDHSISQALRDIVTTYGNKEFLEGKHSLKDLAKIASGIAEPDVKHSSNVRDALAKTHFSQDQLYFVPVKEGYVSTTMFGWLRASSSVPEFKHITELTDYMIADADTRTIPEVFTPQAQVSSDAISNLAFAGDPMARRLAYVFGSNGASSDKPLQTSETLPSASQVEGRTIAFERAATVVLFTKDFRGFLVRDAGTNKPLFAGNAVNGVTKTFGPRAPKLPVADAEAVHSGLRM